MAVMREVEETLGKISWHQNSYLFSILSKFWNLSLSNAVGMETGITALMKLRLAEKLNLVLTFPQTSPIRRRKRKSWPSENLKAVWVDYVVISVWYILGQFLEML